MVEFIIPEAAEFVMQEISASRLSVAVPSNAPPEDQIICQLVNQGFNPKQLLRAAWSLYRHELQEALRAKPHVPVLGGLFAGMLCNTTTLSSVLLAKQQGTYEAELQDLIFEWASDVQGFVDIGCAEGFYVNGIAHWLKIPCVGVDINPAARDLVLGTAQVNGYANFVSFQSSVAEAISAVQGKILVLVDVDGHERLVLGELFDSLFAFDPNGNIVREVVLVVETDVSANGEQNTAELVEILVGKGASIQAMARQDPLRRFSQRTRHLSFMDQCVHGLEGRGPGQLWLLATWKRS